MVTVDAYSRGPVDEACWLMDAKAPDLSDLEAFLDRPG